MKTLRVTVIKPAQYDKDGHTKRFWKGFLPDPGLPHLEAVASSCQVPGHRVRTRRINEYTERDLEYLKLLDPSETDVLVLASAMSCHVHRSLDLAALALERGVRHVVMGGHHTMTCDTSEIEGRGLSIAKGEAELDLGPILQDAARGELSPVYGASRRWAPVLDVPPVRPPTRQEFARSVVRYQALCPARGCPKHCTFCSVPVISGALVRGLPIPTILESVARGIRAGVKHFFFTSDNANKWGSIEELLHGIIRQFGRISFMVQCDTELVDQPELVELFARAGCAEIFFGFESFDRETLKRQGKAHNHPKHYRTLIDMCHAAGIRTYASNIIGFETQTEADVLEHLGKLIGLGPSTAAFYWLTPIPGTVDYKKARDSGRLREPNLDYYDATWPTTDHPHISAERARELLFHCYREFFSAVRVGKNLWRRFSSRAEAAAGVELGAALFYRACAAAGMHPMSGGIWRLRLNNDKITDYISLRRKRFGLDLVSLPANLRLGVADRPLGRAIV